MAIQYSVSGSGAVGAQTVQLPESGDTIVAIASGSIMTLALDATRTAILNGLSGAGAFPIFTKVTYKTLGQNLTYTNVIGSTIPVVFYFGTPFAGAKPLSTYAGVFVSNVFAATGTVILTLTFPSGNLKLTGMSVVTGTTTASYVTATFATSTGKQVLIQTPFNVLSNDGIQNDSIVALETVQTSNTLAVSVFASAALTAYLIAYYA